MLWHPATLRAFPAISYRFLRQCAHLPDTAANRGAPPCISRFRSHFEDEFQESLLMKLRVGFEMHYEFPARYCTGYLSDIGTPKPWAAGDFAGWFEAYIGGHRQMFDPRNNARRIGRVLIAQGRDASDVPIAQTFGPNTLISLKVWTEETA
jgi:hypothetical protein